MPRRAYIEKSFRASTLKTLRQAQAIIEEYEAQGYALTLRQLYYQLVARDLIPNEQKAYNRLGRIISDGRMAGHIDWEAIEDRTRALDGNSHWTDPSELIEGAAQGYRIDTWEDQPRRVEVWVEKSALVSVLERCCTRLDVDFFACRGYTSQSEMWRAGQRLYGYVEGGQPVTILHLGDHDPSGIDMTRDIRERLHTFIAQDHMRLRDQESITRGELDEMIEVERIALNKDQIDRYGPPANPAKTTDSRFESYLREHGTTSWELDALEPAVLERLITARVEALRDDERWRTRRERQEAERTLLRELSDNLDAVQDFLGD